MITSYYMQHQTKLRPEHKNTHSKKEIRQQELAKLIAKIIIRISFEEFYGKSDMIDDTQTINTCIN